MHCTLHDGLFIEALSAGNEFAILVSSSPRPHSHRDQRHLLAVRCRDGCGGEGQGEGAESSVVPPPLPNPLPHPLAVKIVSFE